MREPLPLRQRIRLILLAVAILGGIALAALELKNLINTVNGGRLALFAGLTGVLLGVFVGLRLARRYSLLEDKLPVVAISLVAMALLAVPLASGANRLLSPRTTASFQFVEQKASYALRFGIPRNDPDRAPDQYLIVLARDGALYRLYARRAAPADLKMGDSLRVYLREGFFGFPILEGLADRNPDRN